MIICESDQSKLSNHNDQTPLRTVCIPRVDDNISRLISTIDLSFQTNEEFWGVSLGYPLHSPCSFNREMSEIQEHNRSKSCVSLRWTNRAKRTMDLSRHPQSKTIVLPISIVNQLRSRMAEDSFLARRFGVSAKVFIPNNLTMEEKAIEEDIGRLFQIIENHLGFWGKTGSKMTVDALISAKHTVLALLDAIHKPDHRLEYTCAAIYNKNLCSLLHAIRAPVVNHTRGDRAQAQELRERITADKADFKRLLKDIITGLKRLCIEQIDNVTFQQFAAAPKNAIEAWCDSQFDQIDKEDIHNKLDNEDGLEITFPKPPAPPPGIFN